MQSFAMRQRMGRSDELGHSRPGRASSKSGHVRCALILLQKSLATVLNNDSVALMRFAVEAIDDGAAQSRPR